MLQPFEFDPNEKNKHKFMVQSMLAPDGAVESTEQLVSGVNCFKTDIFSCHFYFWNDGSCDIFNLTPNRLPKYSKW